MDDSYIGSTIEIKAFTSAFKHLSISIENGDNQQITVFGTDITSHLHLRLNEENHRYEILNYNRKIHESQQIDNLERQNLPDFGVTSEEIMNPRKKIRGDGNCMFRCFSYFIFENEQHYDILRHMIVYQIAMMWREAEVYITGEGVYGPNNLIADKDHYIIYMLRTGTFGAYPELVGFSRLFPTVCLVIYDYNDLYKKNEFGVAVINKSIRPTSYGRANGPKLFLVLFGTRDSGHYEIIKCDNLQNFFEMTNYENNQNITGTQNPAIVNDLMNENANNSVDQDRGNLSQNGGEIRENEIRAGPMDTSFHSFSSGSHQGRFMRSQDGGLNDSAVWSSEADIDPDEERRLNKARNYVNRHFYNNPLGSVCMVCERIWFAKDMSTLQKKKVSYFKYNNAAKCK